MPPGEYLPDSTEGITRVEDLPQPLVEHRSRSFRRRRCPHCRRGCYRDTLGRRVLHDLGDSRRDPDREIRPGRDQPVRAQRRGEALDRVLVLDRDDRLLVGEPEAGRLGVAVGRDHVEPARTRRLEQAELRGPCTEDEDRGQT